MVDMKTAETIKRLLDKYTAELKEAEVICSRSTNPQLDCTNEREAFARGKYQALRELQVELMKN